MKKIFISVLAIFALCLSFTSCESKEEVKTEGEAVVSFVAELPPSMVNRAPKSSNDSIIVVNDTTEND